MARGRARGGSRRRRVRWRRGGGERGRRQPPGRRRATSHDGGLDGEGEEARASAKRVLLDGCPRTAREVSARASAWGACRRGRPGRVSDSEQNAAMAGERRETRSGVSNGQCDKGRVFSGRGSRSARRCGETSDDDGIASPAS